MDIGGAFGQEPGADEPSQPEGSRHAQNRDEERGYPHAEDFPDRGFQSYLEQQDDDPDPGKDVDEGVGGDPLESADPEESEIPQQDPGAELSENGRLAQQDPQMSHQFRGQKDEDEVEQKRQGRIFARGEDHGRQQEEDDRKGKDASHHRNSCLPFYSLR